jgi:hypothetical protein
VPGSCGDTCTPNRSCFTTKPVGAGTGLRLELGLEIEAIAVAA